MRTAGLGSLHTISLTRCPVKADRGVAPVTLEFAVAPDSQPPTNIHVLIGRNGVGKTRLLNKMSQALVNDRLGVEAVGRFLMADLNPATAFASLVSVTFSAFDEFEPMPERQNKAEGLRYSHVGLKRTSSADGKAQPPKTFSQLQGEFARSARLCRNGARADRWRRALEMLETDPIFKDADVASLADDKRTDVTVALASSALDDDDDFKKRASALFGRLAQVTRSFSSPSRVWSKRSRSARSSSSTSPKRTCTRRCCPPSCARCRIYSSIAMVSRSSRRTLP